MVKQQITQNFHAPVGQVINADQVTMTQGASMSELLAALNTLQQLMPKEHEFINDLQDARRIISDGTSSGGNQEKQMGFVKRLQQIKDGAEAINATADALEKIKTTAQTAYVACLAYWPQLALLLNPV